MAALYSRCIYTVRTGCYLTDYDVKKVTDESDKLYPYLKIM